MQTNYDKQQKSRLIKAVLSMIISFILFTVIYFIILHRDLAEYKERYGYIAKNQADHIVTTIDCVMSRTNTLKTMIKQNNGDTTWFSDVAEDVYTSIQDETGVSPKNFAIAPNGVVSDVYPLEGNAQLIGFDFLDTSLEGNLEAKSKYYEKHDRRRRQGV